MKREEKVDTQIGSKLLFPISKEIGLRRPALAVVLILALPFLSVSLAWGQATANSTGYDDLPGPGPVITLSSVAQPLDETCVVAVLNRTTQVNHDGTWILPTIPANFGPVRARATCVRNGVTQFGQSDLFNLGTNQSLTLPAITLGNTTPIPTGITISTTTPMLTQAGGTTQLTTMATYSDGSSENISASSTGTQYRTSNATIAVISSEGLVTAVNSGTVVIQALNEGEQGILNIQVVIAGANNGGIPNSWILTNFCPNFSAGSPCPQLTDPAFPSEDPDHDGLTNLQEFQLGTNPNNPDTDGDGLTDGQEALVYHTNPLLFSTDGTGISDGIEVQTGTLGGTLAAKLAKALQSLEVKPTTFLLAVNSLSQQASQQLDVIGHLIDGKTTIDLTSTQEGTIYSSSDLHHLQLRRPGWKHLRGECWHLHDHCNQQRIHCDCERHRDRLQPHRARVHCHSWFCKRSGSERQLCLCGCGIGWAAGSECNQSRHSGDRRNACTCR